jgi:hypothetical protein
MVCWYGSIPDGDKRELVFATPHFETVRMFVFSCALAAYVPGVCLLLQYPLQNCARGGRGIVEGM